MRPVSFQLSQSLSQKFQISNNAPSIAVYVRQRYWDDPNKDKLIDGLDPNQKWYQLTNRAMSIEIQQSVDQFASSFTVLMANEEGELAPDNYPKKWPQEMKFRGHPEIAYPMQLFPNNEVLIYLGYGEELITAIRGFIEDTKISADGSTVMISCMTSYKQVLHQTAPKAMKTPKGNMFDVLKWVFFQAGVSLRGEKMYIPGTTEEWVIKKPIEIARGQAYDEVVRKIIDDSFHYIKPNDDGSCQLIPVPRIIDTDTYDTNYDEGVNLTTLDYTATDRDVHAGVAVKCGNHTNYFVNNFLLKTVSLDKFKEETVENEWADTFLKRRETAAAAHMRNLQRWRTLSAGIVMDPRLELWDKVRISEQVSSATRIYFVKGITTMVSVAGAFQVLDLCNVYDYNPMPRSNEPTIKVTEKLTINLKRLVAKDKADLVNIYVNDKLVKSNVALGTTATSTVVTLPKATSSYITIEGVSCYNKKVSGNVELLSDTGTSLKKMDFEFKKSGVNKKLMYEKRPTTSIMVST